jgi:protein-disulfide isomerase
VSTVALRPDPDRSSPEASRAVVPPPASRPISPGRGARRRGVALLAVLAVATALAAAPALGQTPEVPREAIEEVIREYLLSHPELIIESLRRAQQREREAARARGRAAVRTHREALSRDPESPVGGNPAGDVTLVEFFDYRCPHCRRMAPVIKTLLAEDPQVRLVYKELPILGEESVVAARAALAAGRQGKYAEAHDRLMAEAGPLTRDTVLATLKAIGLDGDRLAADMDAPQVATLIGKEFALAQALGIDGTPAFVVGDELVVGAVDLGTLRELISRARRAP